MAKTARHNPVGTMGRVTVPIPSGGPGEVLIPIRGGCESFAAWADVPVAKHEQVLVVSSLSGRSVVVTPISWGFGPGTPVP